MQINFIKLIYEVSYKNKMELEIKQKLKDMLGVSNINHKTEIMKESDVKYVNYQDKRQVSK